MRELLTTFTEPFLMSVLFGMIASIILTLPILGILYHRRNRLEFSTVLSVYLSILYVFTLAFFTLYPLPDNPATYCATHTLTPQLNPFGFLDDLRRSGMAAVLQIAMNVVFFLPLGFILKRLFAWRWFAIVPAGAAVSLLIETAQLTGLFGIYPCSYRLFDVDDIVWNTAGAIVGMVIAIVWNRVNPKETAVVGLVERPGLMRRLVAFLLDYVIILFGYLLLSIPAALWVGNKDLSGVVAAVSMVLMFIVFQAIVPWFRSGQTLAGSFVHMSFETKPRTGARRVVFYVVRLAVVYFIMELAQGIWYGAALVMLLIIFWLVKREMPYDLI